MNFQVVEEMNVIQTEAGEMKVIVDTVERYVVFYVK